jgi:hypothetical protein
MARVFAQDVIKISESQGIDSTFETILLAAGRIKKFFRQKTTNLDHWLSVH